MHTAEHTFHIPVMGLGFTIDSPVKVAKYGINSVVSIIEDGLIEQMREYYCKTEGLNYEKIEEDNIDHRAKRISAYLNLINHLINKQIEIIRKEEFIPDSDITKYFELLSDENHLSKTHKQMLKTEDQKTKLDLQEYLRKFVKAGSIDVNIMTKCDKTNYNKNGEELPVEYADAMAALRGYAESDIKSSLVLSAGLNPRLYSYCEQFEDFKKFENGEFTKKIVLKVSDYRSALIQGKYFAKKGLWVSEFRIESGLNCGGHAFPTNGILLGPILEEFKSNKSELFDSLYELYEQSALKPQQKQELKLGISVQGGIGTAEENKFLLEYYQITSTGWGSPFLLVPEATNVDNETLEALVNAEKSDYYLSHASPLGVPFNNFKNTSSQKEKIKRILAEKPGSPCFKKFLSFNTEFTQKPICTASRKYQNLKLKEINNSQLTSFEKIDEIDKVLEKECLCSGLSNSALIKNNLKPPFKQNNVSICPGPNLAFFSKVFTLKQMVDHIYGRFNALNTNNRPSMFINELVMYVDYLRKQLQDTNKVKQKYIDDFKGNLLNGIEYYSKIGESLKFKTSQEFETFKNSLFTIKNELSVI
jgi:hypothetical protein